MRALNFPLGNTSEKVDSSHPNILQKKEEKKKRKKEKGKEITPKVLSI